MRFCELGGFLPSPNADNRLLASTMNLDTIDLSSTSTFVDTDSFNFFFKISLLLFMTISVHLLWTVIINYQHRHYNNFSHLIIFLLPRHYISVDFLAST